MKTEIERATAPLIGKALWRCYRTLDMALFDFGRRRKRLDSQGNTQEVGEFALHVQCPWRITQKEQVVVGSQDLYYPANYRDEEDVPPEFDWERDLNRLDKLVRSVFENAMQGFIVQTIEVAAAGSLHIALSEDLSLDVLPCDSLSHEYWRLFEPDQVEPHFVVTGNGIKP